MNRGPGYYHMLAYLVVYFFINGFLLPEGLLFTTLLTPFMLYFLYKQGEMVRMTTWFLLFLIPLPFHVFQPVQPTTYLISGLLVTTAFIFFATSLVLIKKYQTDLQELCKSILILNMLLTGIALLTLPMAQTRDWMWYSVPLSAGIDALARLKMLTYEPSYYALIMTPVFFYFIFRVMYEKEKHPMLIILACLIPLLLSLSFGVIGASAIALMVTAVLYWKKLPARFQRTCVYGGIMVAVCMTFLMLAWPENPVALRLENIAQGKDTSAMGRLVYSFMFAWELATRYNWFFGVGPGQIKILAHDLIVNHYQYHGVVAETVRIPNSMAEMLATYGVYGFTLKLILEIWFFVKKRIWANVFAFTLFIFLFIYQFTGSFIVNVAELGAWAIVFGARFQEFECLSNHPGKEETP